MLISCDRHTRADLDFWAELEAADLVHGSRRRISDLAERSIWAIREFAAKGRFYVSLSWGKDSCVLAHLCMRAGLRGPYVHLKAIPTGNPENDRVRDAWLSILEPDAYDERPVDYRTMPADLDFDAVEAAKDRLFYATFRGVEKTWGNRHISGIRADESHGRKMRMRRWGMASDNALAPLGWWTAADVFGYLAVHDLPVHPTYGMLGGGRWDRRHLRVDELGGERGTGMGRREWEQAYYGDVLRRLEAGGMSERANPIETVDQEIRRLFRENPGFKLRISGGCLDDLDEKTKLILLGDIKRMMGVASPPSPGPHCPTCEGEAP